MSTNDCEVIILKKQIEDLEKELKNKKLILEVFKTLDQKQKCDSDASFIKCDMCECWKNDFGNQ